MKTNEIKGTSLLVLGYGREGKSVEAWLKRWYPAMRVDTADKKDGDEYLSHLSEYDTVIRSPGVSPYQPKIVSYIKNGGHMTSATNIFFSLCPGLTIGVTGTKGKSTTASLIAHLLANAGPAGVSSFSDVRLVGNIGIPMLDHLEGATIDTVFVMELSSHQLADVRYSPHIAVLLHIVPEHMEYYPDFETYKAAKAHIVQFQTGTDVVVYNPMHAEVTAIVEKAKSIRSPFTHSDASSFTTNLLGNAENIMAAVTVARVMKVPEQIIQAQLGTFVSLPHRLEFVGEKHDVRYVNDSLATIPEATVHALDALGPDVTTLIAGGFDRGVSYDVLGKRLAGSSVTTLILFSDTGKKIWDALLRVQPKTSIQKYDVSSMEEAVHIAQKETTAGKICLLSPASASYNMFRDYADRGEQFKYWVKK